MHRRDGIRSLQCILDRCIVDDEGCWEWRGAMSSGTARCYLPGGVIGKRSRVTSARLVAWVLKNGPVRGDQVIYRKPDCSNPRCVNPDHAKKGSRGQQCKTAAKRQGVTPQKLAQLTRARSGQILPREIVDAIQADLDRGIQRQTIARKHQIHHSTVAKIAQGKHATQRAGVIPNASVFTWRQAA